MSLNLKELNRVEIVYGDLKFSAYLQNEVNLTTSSNVDEFTLTPPAMGGLSDIAQTLLINKITGKVPALDIPRNFAYKGTNPITFELQCLLVLESDPDTDYNKPLTNLYTMALPTRDGTLLEAKQAVTNYIKTGYAKWTNENSGVAGTVLKATISNIETVIPDFIKNLVSGADNIINEFAREAYFLNVPPAFLGTGGATLYLGKNKTMVFNSIIIKSIGLTIPKLILDMGYPDHLMVYIEVETLRVATTDLLSGFSFISKRREVPTEPSPTVSTEAPPSEETPRGVNIDAIPDLVY